MALAPGARLGSYVIHSALGAGGMGEVYRATDTKLKRQVAIKILPPSLATDPDRLARFQREAEVLASLNHPHIAALYGLEEADGVKALVMELVEGPTLAERLASGSGLRASGLPLDEVLPIARQIAEALEAAHEQGIIHRDLKPANIKLRPDGTVKVLDFGLAKALGPDVGRDFSPAGGASQSPTMTSPAATMAGVILGTAAYMSPEQARGKPVDKRTDIWAFGCVLYEMLSGKRAFTGDEVSDVLARILERDPDFGALPSATPTAIRRLLRRSLEKDRKRRLPDIAVARLEIDEAMTTPAEPVVAPPRRIAWRVVAGTALLTGAVVATAATLYVRRSTPNPVVTRLEISTPGAASLFQFALSPDGRRLAFSTSATGPPQVAVRSFDQVEVQILAGTGGSGGSSTRSPFWAPDSRTIGFFADGKLKRVDLAGGAPQVLADAVNPRGGTWNDEGVIVFASSNNSGLMRVSATGGTPVAVTQLAAGQGGHMWPQFLPDGRHVLFLAQGGQPATHGIYLASLEGGEPTRVVAAEQNAMYAPPGYLLRVSQGVLVARRFDTARAAVSGDPIPVAQGVGQDDGFSRSAFSVSPAGTLAHRSGVGGSRRQLVWVDRAGKVLGTVGPPDENTPSSLALAHDGQHVANARSVQGNRDIWLTEVARAVATRFTFDPGIDFSPIWSPDGARVVFRSQRNGQSDLFIKPANGATDEQPLLVTPQEKTSLDWSRDGRFLLYANQDPKTQSDLWVLPLTGEKKPFPVVQTAFDETQGQFSPDGRWLAYTSNESGRDEIYIRPFPEPGGKRQASTGGGSQPRWRPDGKELFYVAADAKLMAVSIRVTPEGRAVDAGAPVALFPSRLASGPGIGLTGFASRALYAVAADGRFLMNVGLDAADVPPLTVVQNWDAGLAK